MGTAATSENLVGWITVERSVPLGVGRWGFTRVAATVRGVGAQHIPPDTSTRSKPAVSPSDLTIEPVIECFPFLGRDRSKVVALLVVSDEHAGWVGESGAVHEAVSQLDSLDVGGRQCLPCHCADG
jgi:hypothetical protein